jgi:hypothetical protein
MKIINSPIDKIRGKYYNNSIAESFTIEEVVYGIE